MSRLFPTLASPRLIPALTRRQDCEEVAPPPHPARLRLGLGGLPGGALPRLLPRRTGHSCRVPALPTASAVAVEPCLATPPMLLCCTAHHLGTRLRAIPPACWLQLLIPPCPRPSCLLPCAAQPPPVLPQVVLRGGDHLHPLRPQAQGQGEHAAVGGVSPCIAPGEQHPSRPCTPTPQPTQTATHPPISHTPTSLEQEHGHDWHHNENKWWCEFDRDDWVPEWKDKCKDHCPGECRPRKKEVRC